MYQTAMSYGLYTAYTLVLLSMPSLAATHDAAEQSLTANSSRAWVVQRHAPSHPEHPGCEAEDTYTFTINHELDVNRCERGHMRPHRYAWSIEQAASGPVLVVTGLGEYALSFGAYPPAPRRLLLQPTRAMPGADLVLRSNED